MNNNKNRQDSIVASVLKRNNDSSRNPLERTLEAYKLDKNNLDDSFRLTDFEDAIATKVADQLHKFNLEGVKGNKNDSEFDNKFETDEVTKFYTDELKGLIGDVGGMSRSMLKNQLARMDALMETLADSDSDKDNFLLDQYAQSVTFLEDEYKRKSNVMMRTQTFMGNLASEYLDVQSLYSGFVDHNPLAMGLFKLGKNALDDHRTAKMERKQLVETDLHRQEQARNSEQLKEVHLAEEKKRADELHEANLKAGNIPDDNNNTDNKNTSSKPNVRKSPSIPNTGVESKIPDIISGNETETVRADQIRDENLAKKQFKLQESTAKTTAKWQKDVIKKLNKLHRVSGGKRGRRGGGVGMAGKAGMLDGLGGTVKTVGAGLVGAMGATMAATGALATTATVGVGAAVGTAIGTGISKGYESLRGGKGSIGTDFYDLINDNATIKNLEKRKVVDRDWLGDSELDRSKLSELHADELKALLQLKDFDKGDTQAIMKALKKKTDERLKRIENGREIRRNRQQERMNSMTPDQRVREFGFDPIQRDNDNSSFLSNSLANRDKPLDLTKALQPLPSSGIDVNKVFKDAKNRANGFSVSTGRETGAPLPSNVGGASSPAIKALLEQVAVGEGTSGDIGYDKLFGAQKDGSNRFDIAGRKKLTDMTLDEVRAYQDKFLKNQLSITGKSQGSTAVGKGQFIRKTFDSVRTDMGLDGSTKFTPEIQDAMMEHLIRKEGGLNKFLASDKTGADKVKFAQKLSSQYSSVADPTSGVSAHTFQGKRQRSVNNVSNLNNVMNSLANPTTARQIGDADIPVQNNGSEKVQHIEKTVDMIEEKKDKASQPVVISQQANTSTAQESSSSDTPAVPSARNNDSSLSRVTDRYVSHSMV